MTDSQYIVVAAPGDEYAGLIDAGAVHVFDKEGHLLQTLRSPDAVAGEEFGLGVATIGNNIVCRSTKRNSDGAVYFFEFD